MSDNALMNSLPHCVIIDDIDSPPSKYDSISHKNNSKQENNLSKIKSFGFGDSIPRVNSRQIINIVVDEASNNPSPISSDNHVLCSVCKVNISNQTQFKCENCISSVYIVCTNCVHNDHIDDHNLITIFPELKMESFSEMCDSLKSSSVRSSQCSSSQNAKKRHSISSGLNPFVLFDGVPIIRTPSGSSKSRSSISSLSSRNNSISPEQVSYLSSELKKVLPKRNYQDEIKEFIENNYNELYLDCCELSELPIEVGELICTNKLKHLEVLNLENNCISTFDTLITHLQALTRLNIRENNLTQLPDEISRLKNLMYLDISNNKISSLPSTLSKCTQLITVTAEYNNFAQIPIVLFDMPWISDVYINSNPEISNWPLKEYLCIKTNMIIHIDNKPSLIKIWNSIHDESISVKVEWIRHYPSHVIDNLYLGSIRSALTDYVYNFLNINTVFTIARETNPLILSHMTHKVYPIDDNPNEKISFENIDDLHEHIQKGCCLIHCFMGVSRSSTFLIAYIMKYYQLRLDDAFHLVKQSCPNIYPNDGFWQQLINFDKELYPNAIKKDFTNTRS
jgi:Leucine-rich repeat (LRR) protein